MPPATQIRDRETKPKATKEARDPSDNMACARKVTNEWEVCMSKTERRKVIRPKAKSETDPLKTSPAARIRKKNKKDQRRRDVMVMWKRKPHIAYRSIASRRKKRTRLNEKQEADLTSVRATVKAKEQGRLRVWKRRATWEEWP